MSIAYQGKKKSFILRTDAYKIAHWKFLPPNTTKLYGIGESRGVTDPGVPPRTLFFGLQMALKKWLEGVVFDEADVEYGKLFNKGVFGFDGVYNYEGWKQLLQDHKGTIPVEIKALPEGSLVDSHNVLWTVESTDPKYPWIATYIESLLLQSLWYPTSVATTSFGIKKLIRKWAEKTGGSMQIPVSLNDFGYRGASSDETAEIGGCAHLVNFLGSDNLPGIQAAIDYYGARPGVGISVPATEHSETIIWGEDHEAEAYKYFMEQYPQGYISIVSDSYDLNNAVKLFSTSLRDQVLTRDGVVVVRPDSGYPPDIMRHLLNQLWDSFGGNLTDKGYKVLNTKVRIIYGDWMSYGMIDKVCSATTSAGFSTDNFVFGMGGALLQMVNRDTFKFAFKASAAEVDGLERTFSKHPKDDPGKNSKAGKYMVLYNKWDGKFTSIPEDDLKADQNQLRTVFKNGKILIEEDFETIRKRADSFLNVA